MTSKFITFEGGEGSGKTTQSKLLYNALRSKGIDCLWTREIGGTSSAEQIREILLREELLNMTEILLVMAARFEHVEKVIKPALEAGKTVICDRFLDSTMSYQDSEQAHKLHCEIFGSFMPDKTFFIDLEPKVALKRAVARGDGNKFEEKNMAFHQKAYDNFKMLAEQFKDRIVVIDGSGGVEKIHERIWKVANL